MTEKLLSLSIWYHLYLLVAWKLSKIGWRNFTQEKWRHHAFIAVINKDLRQQKKDVDTTDANGQFDGVNGELSKWTT